MSSPLERQYLTPNCTLFLEGFSDVDHYSQDSSSVMSVLTQAKCQIIGTPHILQGGLTFLENLTKAISSYTQGLLSGLVHPEELSQVSDYIKIEKIPEQNRHLLIWKADQNSSEPELKIELSTVQLFDLLDVIDQFCQDKNTLPQIQDKLQPLPRRYRQAETSFVEQSTPATLGLISFSVATVLLFFIPYPQEIENPNLQPPAINNETDNSLPENRE